MCTWCISYLVYQPCQLPVQLGLWGFGPLQGYQHKQLQVALQHLL